MWLRKDNGEDVSPCLIMKGPKIGGGFESLLLSTNGGNRYPFTCFGIEFSIGSFFFYSYWFKKDLLKENTGYVSLNH
jgi:hypothetical protein